MDYLQNTSNPSSEATTVTQLLPMAAPLPPISTSKRMSHLSTNMISQSIGPTIDPMQQIRSSSAPADCMLTSSSSTAFLGTFASTPSFPTALQQSQQQFSAYTGGRPRHHTTTNVLSLEPMESSQESHGFLGDELQQATNKF